MKGIRIRPEHMGVRATLFDLEADIMEAVWGQGWDLFAVTDIHARLQLDRPIAYTTVMTTVSRLHDKGLLERRREGRRYLYAPVMDREAFLQAMAREVLDSLCDSEPETAVALLVDRVAAGGGSELDRLEALIRARRKEIAG